MSPFSSWGHFGLLVQWREAWGLGVVSRRICRIRLDRPLSEARRLNWRIVCKTPRLVDPFGAPVAVEVVAAILIRDESPLLVRRELLVEFRHARLPLLNLGLGDLGDLFCLDGHNFAHLLGAHAEDLSGVD